MGIGNTFLNKTPIAQEIRVRSDKWDSTKLTKYKKKCSKSLATREIKLKIALRFHHTPVRIANIKKSKQVLSRMWGRMESLHTLDGNVN
jgi:hypothetical protein